MTNVVHLRPLGGEQSARTEDPAQVSRHLVKTALTRLYSFARSDGMENTAMALELALTAVEVDYEERRR